MDHHKIAKDQFFHMLYGVAFFLLIALTAIGLDLLSAWVGRVGASQFTIGALSWSAHAMLVLDLVLFFSYLIVATWELLKGMR